MCAVLEKNNNIWYRYSAPVCHHYLFFNQFCNSILLNWVLANPPLSSPQPSCSYVLLTKAASFCSGLNCYRRRLHTRLYFPIVSLHDKCDRFDQQKRKIGSLQVGSWNYWHRQNRGGLAFDKMLCGSWPTNPTHISTHHTVELVSFCLCL